MTELAEFERQIAGTGYIASDELLASMWLMSELKRPLLLEGETGVGKTEVGKTLAAAFGCRLIRLQCYEGMDVNTAVYEWNYQRQLIAIRVHETGQQGISEEQLFSEHYLLKRPLLQAIGEDVSPVLLIDEIDRADEEFEAYLLEVLSEFQITVPEIGTLEARSIPYVVLTSNGVRDLSDALRRRCLYHYVAFPSFEKELRIVRARAPGAGEALGREVVQFVQSLRREELQKSPGVAETLDWVAALLRLGVDRLRDDPQAVARSIGFLLKTREDREQVAPEQIDRLLAKVG